MPNFETFLERPDHSDAVNCEIKITVNYEICPMDPDVGINEASVENLTASHNDDEIILTPKEQDHLTDRAWEHVWENADKDDYGIQRELRRR